MLCSRCSARVKPIIAFDIDGTLGDYHGHIADFASAYLGREIPRSDFDGSIPHREWFKKQGVQPREFREIKLAYRQGGMKRSMPHWPDRIELLQKLKRDSMQVELWLTTTRPYMRMDNIDPDTRFWLDRWNVPYDFLLYDETKYQELAQRVDRSRVIAIVDDVDEMYDDAEALFGRQVPILLRCNYNREVHRPNLAHGPSALWEIISRRLEDYERNNG